MVKSNPFKLLFIYANQFGYHTDSYKYCEHLQDVFEIVYVCFDQGLEYITLPNVRVIYMPYKRGKVMRLFFFYRFIIQLTRREKFDILFTVQFKYSFILGLFAMSKIKILDYRTGDLNNNNLIRRLKNRFMWFDSLFFHHISVISEGLRDTLRLNKERTHILPLGADLISDQKRSFERIDLLYLGTLSLRNIDQTIDGFAKFLIKYSELSKFFSYTIIGFGDLEDENKINSVIKKNHLDHKVQFLGRKKYSDLSPYFNNCNIGVSYVPMTAYFEYQPVTKLFEYMLSGMPVIATNTYENKLIVNQFNGVLINDSPEDFCNGLLSIYNKRKFFNSLDIIKSVESFTWRNIVKTNLKPYLEKLVDGHI